MYTCMNRMCMYACAVSYDLKCNSHFDDKLGLSASRKSKGLINRGNKPGHSEAGHSEADYK